MIVQKTQIFLKFMNKLSRYMPLPNYWRKSTKWASKTKESCQISWLFRKIYSYVYLFCVAAMFLSDFHGCQGQLKTMQKLKYFLKIFNSIFL